MKSANSLISVAVSAALLASPVMVMARSADGLLPPPNARALSTAEAQNTGYAASSSSRWAASSSSTSYDYDEEEVDSEEILDFVAEGKGGMMDYSYPYPSYGNGVMVDVSVTKEVHPDTVSLSAYCDAGLSGNRAEVKAALKKLYEQVKTAVGSDGKVRRSGGYSIYPFYDPQTGMPAADKFSGNVSLWVDLTNLSASERVTDILEEEGCSVSWNVAVEDMHELEYDVLDQLVTKLNKRKEVFEKLLKTDLNKVIGASFSTWIDSWSSYDPDTNTAKATITLTVTFEANSK